MEAAPQENMLAQAGNTFLPFQGSTDSLRISDLTALDFLVVLSWYVH